MYNDENILTLSIDQVNSNMRSFTQNSKGTLFISGCFRKANGTMFDFGLRVSTNYYKKFTTIGFTNSSEVYVDRSQSGDTLGDDPNFIGFKILKSSYSF